MTVAARPRRVVLAGLVGGVAALAPTAAPGQVTLSVDVGAATVAYDEFLRSTAGSVTPSVLVERGRATFLARAAYGRFESGNQSIQGTLAGSVLSPAVWKLRGELGATASTTRYKNISAATNVQAVGRLHLAEPTHGGWLSLGMGGVAQESEFPDDVVQAELGGWIRAGGSTLTAQLIPTRVGGGIRVLDAVAGWRWLGPDGDVSLSAGFRTGEDSSSGVTRWAELNVTGWLSQRVALIGGVGVYPSEVVRGLPGGRYGSVGLRLASRRPTGSDPALVAQLILPYELRRLRRRAAWAEEFVMAVAEDGTRDLRVRVPEAKTVELMADFTDWTPVPLTRERGGLWGLNIFIAPGVHRVNIRVDGGPWQAPPGLTTVEDEFGGVVGLLVVQ